MEILTYQSSPSVTFATNTFINVPIILQYDDTPLISVVKEANLGFTSEFRIYHADGTDMARVRGTRIFATEAGKLAGLSLRQLADGAVFEMAGKTVFEVKNEPGAAFKTSAELYTPDGFFVRSSEKIPFNMGKDNEPLRIGGVMISRSKVIGCKIGIRIGSDGSFGFGCN